MEGRETAMRNKIGNICMLLGAGLVLAALSLFIWNQWEDRQAGVASERILIRLIEQMDTSDAEGKNAYPDPYAPAMTEVEIDGYDYIGYLTIPSLALELPVMSEWDYERLEMAPCRYAGTVQNDDLVIAAHNYSEHFGKISRLSEGEKVCFVDVNGIKFCYDVVAVEMLTSNNVEGMTAGAYDLTLFTCDYGGENRVTVRCVRAQ